MLDGNGLVGHMRKKKMQANRQVLRSRSGRMICCNFNAAFVISEGVTSTLWRRVVDIETMLLQFFQKVDNVDDVT